MQPKRQRKTPHVASFGRRGNKGEHRSLSQKAKATGRTIRRQLPWRNRVAYPHAYVGQRNGNQRPKSVQLGGQTARVMALLASKGMVCTLDPRLPNLPQVIAHLKHYHGLRIMPRRVCVYGRVGTRYWLLDKVSYALEVSHGS